MIIDCASIQECMRFEDIEAMTTQENESKAQQAQRRLQQAFDAYNDGKLDKAEEAFGDAEIHFRLMGDFKRAGDCRFMIADIQRQNNALEKAINSYQRARRLYRDAQRPLNEAASLLAMGHVERQLAHLDRAQDLYQQALQLYQAHHDAQGSGNAELALGHIELQRGQMHYAAEHYQDAIRYFSEGNDIIHEADASRSLEDI